MTLVLPDLVLVHGGEHAADCWDLTVAQLRRRAPELQVLAVDLPGRRSKPADLATVTVTDWVASVVADTEAAGLGEIVIVGRSIAGLTVPGVVAKLGSMGLRRITPALANAVSMCPNCFTPALNASCSASWLRTSSLRKSISCPVFSRGAPFPPGLPGCPVLRDDIEVFTNVDAHDVRTNLAKNS
jgi:Alpha/beta hydrolase family